MPDYTVEKIHNDINNSLAGSLLFKDPYGGCSFILTSDDGWFNVTTVLDSEVRGTGRVVWSDYHQAFAGPGYNIPMSWKV